MTTSQKDGLSDLTEILPGTRHLTRMVFVFPITIFAFLEDNLGPDAANILVCGVISEMIITKVRIIETLLLNLLSMAVPSSYKYTGYYHHLVNKKSIGSVFLIFLPQWMELL